jgi:hypothetical protein
MSANRVPAPGCASNGARATFVPLLLALFLPRLIGASDWAIRIGPAWRMDNALRVNYDAAAVSRGLRGSSTTRIEPGAGAASIGAADAYAERVYDDGFVFTDPGTADPETDVPGLTWNWGYDTPGQNDGQSVGFHAQGRQTQAMRVVPLAAASERFEKDFELVGLLGELDYAVWRGSRASLGISLSAAWYPDEEFAFRAVRDAARRTETTAAGIIVDRYVTSGYTAPDAPYAGSYEGPGPLINNRPDSRSETMTYSSRSTRWSADSRVEIEMRQSELALGPWLDWILPGRIRLRLSPQLLLARVSLEVESQTTYNPAPPPSPLKDFNRQAETTDWIAGAGLEAGLRFDVYRGWTIGGSLSAAWWADDVAVRAEPFDAKVDLGTWRASVAIGKEF